MLTTHALSIRQDLRRAKPSKPFSGWFQEHIGTAELSGTVKMPPNAQNRQIGSKQRANTQQGLVSAMLTLNPPNCATRYFNSMLTKFI